MQQKNIQLCMLVEIVSIKRNALYLSIIIDLT